jgi:hypothetical protein
VDLTCHPKFPFAFEEITIAFEVDGSIINKNNGPLGLSVNRKIKYTIPTPHNFAKVDFMIK